MGFPCFLGLYQALQIHKKVLLSTYSQWELEDCLILHVFFSSYHSPFLIDCNIGLIINIFWYFSFKIQWMFRYSPAFTQPHSRNKGPYSVFFRAFFRAVKLLHRAPWMGVSLFPITVLKSMRELSQRKDMLVVNS